MTEHKLAPPPAKVYRVGKFPNPWTRSKPIFGSPSACRYDDPLGRYRTIYAASSRYDAYLATLAEFRPGPNSDIAAKVTLDALDAEYQPSSQAGAVLNWITKRYIGEGTLNGIFLDLTQPSSLTFLRARLATYFKRYEITDIDADSLTYAPRELTMEISRCVYELENRGYERFDGLAYRSRLAGGMQRWAIFANPEGAPETIIDATGARIGSDDPDLIQAIRDCDIDAQFSSARNVWLGENTL